MALFTYYFKSLRRSVLFTQTSTTFALFIDYLFLGSFIYCIRVAPAGYYLFTALSIDFKSLMRHLLYMIIYHLFRRQDIFIIRVYSSWAFRTEPLARPIYKLIVRLILQSLYIHMVTDLRYPITIEFKAFDSYWI